jgi:hypothetical protein
MLSARDDFHNTFPMQIHEPAFIGDAPQPAASQLMLEAFGLARPSSGYRL